MNKKIVIPERIRELMSVFVKNKGEIWIVGGAVRDMLLGRKVKDWDFTTNLTPEQMKKIFPKNSFYKNVFGTFSIVLKNKEVVEVTTYRTERGYSDKRHPDRISWGKSLEEDLQRRDFTINAMALGVGGKELVDVYGGKKDLKPGLIRAVGKAKERFAEDALRMMRAVRIAVQLGFDIEIKTFEAIKKSAHLIKKIAMERVRDELFLILLSPNPAVGIDLMREAGLLKHIIPELLAGINFGQKGHHVYDVWTHNLKTLQNCQSENAITRLAALLHDVDKPKVARGEGEQRTFYNHQISGGRTAVTIGKRLKMSNLQLDLLFRLTRWHMFSGSEDQTDAAIRRLIRHVTPEYMDEMVALRRADRMGSGAKETSWRWELFKKRIVEVQKQPFAVRDLKVNGQDVMKILKIRPGPKVGEVLDHLFAEVEKDIKLNKREILLEKIKKVI